MTFDKPLRPRAARAEDRLTDLAIVLAIESCFRAEHRAPRTIELVRLFWNVDRLRVDPARLAKRITELIELGHLNERRGLNSTGLTKKGAYHFGIERTTLPILQPVIARAPIGVRGVCRLCRGHHGERGVCALADRPTGTRVPVAKASRSA